MRNDCCDDSIVPVLFTLASVFRTERAMEASLAVRADGGGSASCARRVAAVLAQTRSHTPYNSLRAHDGCPCMEHGRYSDAIETWSQHTSKKVPRTETRGSFIRCTIACGTFGCDRGYFAQALREALFLMWRAILEPALLFASPFAAYTIYLVLRRNYPFAMEHWTKSAVSTLT